MKEALDFLKENNEVAFATIGNGRPQMRVFQIMKQSGTTLWFATGPHKRVYAELQENPAVEILSRCGNISVRVSGDAVFDVPDDVCKEIYETNPVLPRLYPDYKSLAYFRVEIDRLDYFDLTPTPPVLRHYDRASGQYVDLNPFGEKKACLDDQENSSIEQNPSSQNPSTKLAPTLVMNNGLTLPTAGIGTYSLHGQTCFNSVYSALKSGVRLIDTAYMYGNEKEVGQAVRQAVADGICKREDITVITKIYPGTQYEHPEEAIEQALSKLDIGYIDIMLLHHPGTNDVKAYKAMEKYQAEGKIKSLGISCFYVKELSEFLPRVNVKPVLVQNEIHPYYQDTEVVDFIHKNDIVVQAWYPLGGRGFQDELLKDPVLADIAKAHGKSIVQVILRWHWQRNVVAIPGSSNPAHIAENHDIFDFELTDDEMNRIASLNRNEKHDWY